MTWLVHHEFGLDHRPFAVPDFSVSVEDKFSSRYCLSQWIGVYDFLLQKYKEQQINLVFVCYELLCNNPEAVWGGLAKKAQLKNIKFPNFSIKKSNTGSFSIDDTLLMKKAYSLYKELDTLSRNALID